MLLSRDTLDLIGLNGRNGIAVILEVELSLLSANWHIFLKEALKRCLFFLCVFSRSPICNFDTLTCATDHTLPQVFLSSNGHCSVLLPGYYRIFRSDTTLIIRKPSQQYAGYLFMKSVDFPLMNYGKHNRGKSIQSSWDD